MGLHMGASVCGKCYSPSRNECGNCYFEEGREAKRTAIIAFLRDDPDGVVRAYADAIEAHMHLQTKEKK